MACITQSRLVGSQWWLSRNQKAFSTTGFSQVDCTSSTIQKHFHPFAEQETELETTNDFLKLFEQGCSKTKMHYAQAVLLLQATTKRPKTGKEWKLSLSIVRKAQRGKVWLSCYRLEQVRTYCSFQAMLFRMLSWKRKIFTYVSLLEICSRSLRSLTAWLIMNHTELSPLCT